MSVLYRLPGARPFRAVPPSDRVLRTVGGGAA